MYSEQRSEEVHGKAIYIYINIYFLYIHVHQASDITRVRDV